MHYVKQFHINGVDTRQVACIELQGKPNAATEGQVGVLGVDVTSPTHDVYKCVAVSGSIYTWELLSSGMSIMNAKTTGEGADISFTYDTLLKPNNYVVKVGDLILDRGGYLYQVRAVNNLGCDATYTGAHFGVEGEFGVGHSLVIKEGQLQLVSEYGNVLSKVDYLPIDSSTLYRDATTGTISVVGVRTIDNSLLKFFVNTQAAYDALSPEEKKNLFAIITDDRRYLHNVVCGGLTEGATVSICFQIITRSDELTIDTLVDHMRTTFGTDNLPCSGYVLHFSETYEAKTFVINGLRVAEDGNRFEISHSGYDTDIGNVELDIASDVVIPL